MILFFSIHRVLVLVTSRCQINILLCPKFPSVIWVSAHSDATNGFSPRITITHTKVLYTLAFLPFQNTLLLYLEKDKLVVLIT